MKIGCTSFKAESSSPKNYCRLNNKFSRCRYTDKLKKSFDAIETFSLC